MLLSGITSAHTCLIYSNREVSATVRIVARSHCSLPRVNPGVGKGKGTNKLTGASSRLLVEASPYKRAILNVIYNSDSFY